MTNPRDPEGLMPAADASGAPPESPGATVDDAAGTAGDPPNRSFPGPATVSEPGPEAAAGTSGRSDLDRFGSDPEVRFPGESDDPPMTTADARRDPTDPTDLGTEAGRY